MIMNHNMATEASRIGFLDVQIYENGRRSAHVDFSHTEVEYQRNPPPGVGIVQMRQWGSCTSEIGYYMGSGNAPSRFMQDSANEHKLNQYLPRTLAAGFTSDPADIQRIMVGAPFHEGWGIIEDLLEDHQRPNVPVQMYVPTNGSGPVHLERRIVPMNFQSGFRPGSMAVLNPAYLCDWHSSAEHIDANTGWPEQCNRNTHPHGNLPKATRGHTEAIGTATSGKMPMMLDSLTPISPDLEAFIMADPHRRGILATSTEPLACVYQAHGSLLMNGEIPKSVAVIGDGPNSLLMMQFYQMFAPEAKIVVVGKNREKLDAIQRVNPNQIRTVITGGGFEKEGYDDLSYALTEATGTDRADLVIPTVALPRETIEPFIKDDGMVIWWAASISENVTTPSGPKARGYRERYSYGGAPRSEHSAVAGYEWLLKERPDALEPLFDYPGIYHSEMNQKGASDVQEWLNNRGRFIHPENGLSAKLVVSV